MNKPDPATLTMVAFSGASQLSMALWNELMAERQAHAATKAELEACKVKVEADAGRDL